MRLRHFFIVFIQLIIDNIMARLCGWAKYDITEIKCIEAYETETFFHSTCAFKTYSVMIQSSD